MRVEMKTGREYAEFFHPELIDSGSANRVCLQVAAHRYDQVIKDAYERGRKAGWRKGMTDGLKISCALETSVREILPTYKECEEFP